MATVLNPDGTPIITYNRGGTTIANLTSSGNFYLASSVAVPGPIPTATDGTSADAAQIIRHTSITVVLVTSVSTPQTGGNDGVHITQTGVQAGVILPRVETGDIVEIHVIGVVDPATNIPSTNIYYPVGDTLNGAALVNDIASQRYIVRKVSATDWAVLVQQ